MVAGWGYSGPSTRPQTGLHGFYAVATRPYLQTVRMYLSWKEKRQLATDWREEV